ncbi:MAG TPA: hypothetical protein VFZ95_14680 [Steroidobacteraceae bacterium]
MTVMLAAWWWTRADRAPTPRAERPAAAKYAGVASAPRLEQPASAVAARASDAAVDAVVTSPASPDYRARLRDARDYWDLGESLYVNARQGDAAAQYWLSRALAYCESLYDWYFIVHLDDGTLRHRTLDEAQQLTATRPVFTADDIRDIQKRCHRLRSADVPPFGSSREWLEAATASNYPLAQASAALGQALRGHQADSEAARGARDEARRLALDALRSRDPAVMAQMGDVAANLARDPAEARRQQWVWPLAACLRDNCESMEEWRRLFCNIDTQCQPFETPVDVIRRQAGNDFDAVERQARELNEKLDAGTLEESDIGG